MTFRLFVEDVGPGRFSAVKNVRASSFLYAQRKTRREYHGRTWLGRRLLLLPEDRTDLWPNGKTGALPSGKAMEFLV